MERISPAIVVTVSTRNWVPDRNAWMGPMGQWLYFCPSTGQDGWSVQWLWSYRVCKNSSDRQECLQDPKGQRPCRCTSMHQDSSIKIEMDGIGLAVAELVSARIWVPDRNALKGLMGQDHAIAHLGLWEKTSSTGFEMEWINLAFVELQHPRVWTNGDKIIFYSPPYFPSQSGWQ